MKTFVIELLSGSFFLVIWLVFLLSLRFVWISYSEGVAVMYLPWLVEKKLRKRFWTKSKNHKRRRIGRRTKMAEPKVVAINRELLRIHFLNTEEEQERIEILQQYIHKSA